MLRVLRLLLVVALALVSLPLTILYFLLRSKAPKRYRVGSREHARLVARLERDRLARIAR